MKLFPPKLRSRSRQTPSAADRSRLAPRAVAVEEKSLPIVGVDTLRAPRLLSRFRDGLRSKPATFTEADFTEGRKERKATSRNTFRTTLLTGVNKGNGVGDEEFLITKARKHENGTNWIPFVFSCFRDLKNACLSELCALCGLLFKIVSLTVDRDGLRSKPATFAEVDFTEGRQERKAGNRKTFWTTLLTGGNEGNGAGTSHATTLRFLRFLLFKIVGLPVLRRQPAFVTQPVGVATRSLPATFLLLLLAGNLFAAEAKLRAAPPGLGDPGKATALAFAGNEKALALIGPDARAQLVVTASFDTGQERDWSRDVKYTAKPAGIVRIDAAGLVTPLADGSCTVEATASKPTTLSTTIKITVERFADPPPVNFPNQVVPIFTKLGCNSGGCHGKSGGQNGFALSLLGFEPREDYAHLVQEARGRRVFPGAPDRSLLLVKATSQVPHGGGPRLKEASDDYRVIARWIQQGMPFGQKDDPTVESISVYPADRRLLPDGAQQLQVLAHYTDGSTQDVTSRAQYDVNNKEMCDVGGTGLARMLGKPGQVAVMVRYQGQVAAFLAMAPLGVPVKSLPPESNFADKHVFAKLVELGMPPSQVCDDATYLRRVTLDITGRLPTAEEAKSFLKDQSANKRSVLVDRLLESDGYADFFALKWSAILKNRSEPNGVPRVGNYLFHDWLREQLRENTPYQELVRQILTAAGPVEQSPPVNWYGHVPEMNQQVEDAAQLFLGLRIQCARCHHHPFEKWSQRDYWGMAAFFSTIKVSSNNQAGDYKLALTWQVPQARNPKDGENVPPKPLGEAELEMSAGDDARVQLADWLGRPDNPYFAKALVNRYWKHFLGRGIVDPEDDMRATNPPTNPALLDALAADFIKSGFDLKHLVRTICTSTTYQLASEPNDWNAGDTQSYARYYPRRLPAEVMLDGIDQFLGTESGFDQLPKGMRAVQIPDFGGVNNAFLDSFGRPAGGSACECERGGEINMQQCLQMLNSGEVLGKVSRGTLRDWSADPKREDAEKITELYYRALSRPPTEKELATFTAYLAQAKENEKTNAYEDIFWAVINTKEFVFNH